MPHTDVFIFDRVQHQKSKTVREVLESLETFADIHDVNIDEKFIDNIRKRLFKRLDKLHMLILEED
jgi:hypothetical protein